MVKVEPPLPFSSEVKKDVERWKSQAMPSVRMEHWKEHLTDVGEEIVAAHGIGRSVDPLDLITAAKRLEISRFVKYAERAEAGCLSTTDFVERERIDNLGTFVNDVPPPIRRIGISPAGSKQRQSGLRTSLQTGRRNMFVRIWKPWRHSGSFSGA